MRIISKFHDYYDAVMKSGMDRDVVYIREHKEIQLKKDMNLGYRQYKNDWTIRCHMLGYCGYIIPLFELKYSKYDSTTMKHIERHELFTDIEKFKDFAVENKIMQATEIISKWKSGYQYFFEQDTKFLHELFHQHQVPLFLISIDPNSYSHVILTLNPSLKELGFQRLKDTYTVYQDIFQYVAGVLNNRENNMVQISNDDKIHKAGFDKWSFRKMPSKK